MDSVVTAQNLPERDTHIFIKFIGLWTTINQIKGFLEMFRMSMNHNH